jgi:hypothetical protein
MLVIINHQFILKDKLEGGALFKFKSSGEAS